MDSFIRSLCLMSSLTLDSGCLSPILFLDTKRKMRLRTASFFVIEQLYQINLNLLMRLRRGPFALFLPPVSVSGVRPLCCSL